MNDENNGCIAEIILMAIGIIVILIIHVNGDQSNRYNSTYCGGSAYGRPWKKKMQEYEMTRKIVPEQTLKQYQQEVLRYQNIRVPKIIYSHTSNAPTPDDAYSDGYNNGYEQGCIDGSNGHSHGYDYDDNSSYYNYYETKYQEGYEEGYDCGYREGKSMYENEQEEDY